jgi:hypothetical protein
MPRTIAPRIASPRASSACAGHEGRGAGHHAASRRAAAPVACQSGSAPPWASADLDVRDDAEHAVAHLRWKPFITLSTMISAATPSAMPSIDTPEMKEMKRVAPPGPAGAQV